MHVTGYIETVSPDGTGGAIIAGIIHRTDSNPQYWTVTVTGGSTLNQIETAMSTAIKDAMAAGGEPLGAGDKIMLFGSAVVL